MAHMLPRIGLITLGVADLAKSVAFYRDGLGWQTREQGDVAFIDCDGIILALFGRNDLAKDAGVENTAPTAFNGMSLAQNLGSPEQVDAVFAIAVNAGGRVVKQPQKTEWGGYSGYFADPDGFLWEVAHNPFWPLDEAGHPHLPADEA